MHPNEFSDQLDQLLKSVAAVPSGRRELDHFWHVLLSVRTLIARDWLTMAPGWFQGVIALGPFASAEYLGIENYPRFSTPARYRARMHGVAERECSEFLSGKPLPAYGAQYARLLDLRRHGDPTYETTPIGFLWTLGVNSVRLDQDSNRFVKPPPGFWLRESSLRRSHRVELNLHTLSEVAAEIFVGMRQWHAYRFGPESARLQREEEALDDGQWKPVGERKLWRSAKQKCGTRILLFLRNCLCSKSARGFGDGAS